MNSTTRLLSLDTHNAACGIETSHNQLSLWDFVVPTHTMLRAALKHVMPHLVDELLHGLDTHNAACGIET